MAKTIPSGESGCRVRKDDQRNFQRELGELWLSPDTNCLKWTWHKVESEESTLHHGEAWTQECNVYPQITQGTVGRVAKNRIHRRFTTSIPHQKITTDTSEFKYYEQEKNGKLRMKKLYLAPFLDLFNGEILSYRLSGKTKHTSNS